MNKSESIGKLAAALAKAQSAMDPAKKDAKGNFGKFADLGEVIDVIRKVATPNGLSFSQFPVGDAAGVGVATILMHESGEWLSDTIYLPTGEGMGGRNGAQIAGGNITYLRRYALSAVFGVYADEDTDGQVTGPRRQTAQPANMTKQPASTYDRDARLSVLKGLRAEQAELLKARGETFTPITAEQVKAMTQDEIELLITQTGSNLMDLRAAQPKKTNGHAGR